MASRQPFKEERAEAAAKVAAKDLEEVNRTREHDLGGADQQQHEEQKRGVIGSVLKAVQDTYENAKEAVVGKREPADSDTTSTREVVHAVEDDDGVTGGGEVRDISANKSRGVYDSATAKAKEYADYAAQKAKETKDATKQKTNEYADYAGEKAKEAKDRTVDKAGEYKDYAAEKAKEGKDATMNKMGEYKDYTAEKAKEGKDNAWGKLGELKDYSADAAKRAMGYLGGKKEETKHKTAETMDSAKKEKLSGADEEGRRKMEELKLKDKGYRDESAWRRGNEGVIKAEDTRSGAVAETLKAADQMTGQTFNNVGRLDDEGVTRVGLLDTKK